MLSPLLLSLSPFPAPPIFQLFLEHLFKKLPVPHVPCLSTKSPGHFNAGPEMRRAATFRNFSPPSTKVSTKGQRKRPWTAEQGLDRGQESSPAAQPQGDLPGGVGLGTARTGPCAPRKARQPCGLSTDQPPRAPEP